MTLKVFVENKQQVENDFNVKKRSVYFISNNKYDSLFSQYLHLDDSMFYNESANIKIQIDVENLVENLWG